MNNFEAPDYRSIGLYLVGTTEEDDCVIHTYMKKPIDMEEYEQESSDE